ncbi:uncharacterized protein LOC141633533 [Silene latifolia]|uniref:uncharacterized protein LOC141633533 n=1 Tax=Silene latifolia TaxID=37657 RepID=UPI003D784F7D
MSVISKILPDMAKLESLDGHNYKCWSQKLLMYFEQLEIDYVLFNDPPKPITPTDVETNPPAAKDVKSNEEDIAKFVKDNETAMWHILNNMRNTLFDLFAVNKSAKFIWEALETKYGADDAGKKKYVVGKWLGFQMAAGKPIMVQVHVYENLCADIMNEGMKLDDIVVANVLLEKFPPSWSDYRNQLKHKKKDMSLEELIGHMRTEQANRLKDLPASQSVTAPAVAAVKANLVEFGGPSYAEKYKGKAKVGQGKNQGPAKKNGPGKHTKPVPKIQKAAKGHIVCYVCGKAGHKAYQGSEKKSAEANVAVTDDVIAAVVVEANLVGNVAEWVLILELRDTSVLIGFIC